MINLLCLSCNVWHGPDLNISFTELDLALALAFFLVLLTVFIILYRFLFRYFRKRILSSGGEERAALAGLLRLPILFLFLWILLRTFSGLWLRTVTGYETVLHIINILLIVSLAWLLNRLTEAGYLILQRKLDINKPDNLNARKSLTKINLFKGVVNFLIVFIALAVVFLTFRQARTLGISLLTSAGIAGIIVGFAAQKSIGLILGGIQLAITQPVRLDDVVIVEGEWGRIEEMTLTYVVIRIWDERRLILPSTWFLEKPFQNWTRQTASITGSVFLYVDYDFPVESIRNELPALLEKNPNWDGRIWNVQVTGTTERNKEIRILLSSADSAKNWDLRAAIREQLIDFINTTYPGSFSRIRLETIKDKKEN
jgi:small-conductance mechanosensitive channel